MIFCPVIKMPDYFTRLLRSNMQNSGNLYRSLPVYFEQHPSLTAILKRTFKDIDPKGRVEYILSSLGWHGLRNRLTSVFIYYANHGEFPEHTELSSVNDILAFEERLKKHTVGDFSRVFLLGFYLKLVQIEYGVRFESEQGKLIDVEDDVFILLNKLSTSKLVKLDMFIVCLIHMQLFVGKKNLSKFIGDGATYIELFNSLTEKEKHLLVKNLLAYGASIDESDIFYNRMV